MSDSVSKNMGKVIYIDEDQIRKRLADIPIDIAPVVVNKMGPGETTTDIAEAFPGQSLATLPLVPGGILGLNGLQQFAADHPDTFAGLHF